MCSPTATMLHSSDEDADVKADDVDESASLLSELYGTEAVPALRKARYSRNARTTWFPVKPATVDPCLSRTRLRPALNVRPNERLLP